MRCILTLAVPVLIACSGTTARVGPVKIPMSATPKPMSNFFELSVRSLTGDTVNLSRYRGNKIMVVNTASECGYTPQYRQLQELYIAYQDKGFVVLGFPSNDFGRQEPGSAEEIAVFCEKNYGVTFPMMEKVVTKGAGQHPVYAWLTRKELNGKLNTEVSWNFQKFLINADGTLHTTLAPATDPMSEPVLSWLDDTH
ncbi:MAG: glutathione peroxidase [Flavobacteriales bacterium]|nr:glutathione peroxidase [Flavobacteriales bacterium]